MASELEIVAQWHTALNTGNVERMIALLHRDVEMGGPRGATQGAEVAQEWFNRAHVTLKPVRYFACGDKVVVEEIGEWRSPEMGALPTSQTVASVFVVTNGVITRLLRYDNLDTALDVAGLSLNDAVVEREA